MAFGYIVNEGGGTQWESNVPALIVPVLSRNCAVRRRFILGQLRRRNRFFFFEISAARGFRLPASLPACLPACLPDSLPPFSANLLLFYYLLALGPSFLCLGFFFEVFLFFTLQRVLWIFCWHHLFLDVISFTFPLCFLLIYFSLVLPWNFCFSSTYFFCLSLIRFLKKNFSLI